MKRFLYSFLGTMAGIWLSLLLLTVGVAVTVAVAGVGSISSLADGKPAKVAADSYLAIDLSGVIQDRPGSVDPLKLLQGRDDRAQGLDRIVGAIDASAADARIKGISLYCGGAEMGMAQSQAVREALLRFKAAAPEKWLYAYGDDYSQNDYYIASVADSMYLNPIGVVDLHGLSSTGMYFKGLLDKLGVKVQVVKVGTYKSAVEPFTLDGPSAPAREQQQVFLGNIWRSLCSQIGDARGVGADTVNAWASGQLYSRPAPELVDRGIVDHLAYTHQYEAALADAMCVDSTDDLNPVDPVTLCRAVDINKKGDGRGARIGVLYACGDITEDGDKGIASERLVPEILDLADEDELDGLVMYVNSGGGSAFASEQIWAALQQWKEITGKPLYVAMGDYAASGGYYISCGADRIFAQPTTLTGSIGIFGLIPDLDTLLTDRLGIHTSTEATNPDGLFPSGLKPMTPVQRAAMQNYIDRGYELFTARCAQGRHMSQDSIKAIAEGRVWDGTQALALGLVDQIGGLEAAVAAMGAHLEADTWTVETYPRIKDKWYDLLLDAGLELKASMVRGEVGTVAPGMGALYDTLLMLKGLTPVQARMPLMDVRL